MIKQNNRSGKPAEYEKKRDFKKTPEPLGKASAADKERIFVIHKHAARRLHYDFRLELGGVLLSWAVPKGPGLNPEDKRLAVHVEDHPLEYAGFEGVIPPAEYGGGTVMIWDRGTWIPEGDPYRAYKKGSLKFRLKGDKLTGSWALFRIGNRNEDRDNWLLVKHKDDAARTENRNIEESAPFSVESGRNMEEIARGEKPKKATDVRESEPPDPFGLEGAVKKEMPRSFRPQLARIVEKAPDGGNWLHEIKLDGYRLLAFVEKDSARLVTRNGKDWTGRFPNISGAITKMFPPPLLLDGELVVLRKTGISSFQALQNAVSKGAQDNMFYYVFDIPYCGGYDLTRVRLDARKEFLRRLIDFSKPGRLIRYNDHQVGKGPKFKELACDEGLEGIVCKRADSPYIQDRTSNWLKVKCLRRQEFVIGGYTEPKGARTGFGALALGYYDQQGKLHYCGLVGTGFSERFIRNLVTLLSNLKRNTSPFADSPQNPKAKAIHWVMPRLVAEIKFAEWTEDGILRQPVFLGLREDKNPEEIRREEPFRQDYDENLNAAKTKNGPIRVYGVTLSNPNRIFYPEPGINKRHLAEFYGKIGDYIMPHLAGRPLMILRCPEGREKECFYQKHVNESLPDTVQSVLIREGEEERPYIVVYNLSGLISLVQSGALEFHPWSCRADRLENPDLMIFDLDPGEGVTWGRTVEAAFHLRDFLEKLDLRSFVRTSGGKGLHIVAPLRPASTWDEVKRFAGEVAGALVRRFPDKYVATMSKSKRRRKIFIDFFRNTRGATAICSYSTRAAPGAPVAVPVRWDELSRLQSADAYTVENLVRRLAALDRDPWEGFFDMNQSLSRERKRNLE